MPTIKQARDRTSLGLTLEYVHVGLHKTGTTFLQKNMFPLLEPEIRFVRKSEALFLDGDVVTNLPNVIEALGKSSGAKGPFLLSQEALAGSLFAPDLTAIRQIAARNPELRVIVSLRSQLTIIPSMYFQVVKSGYRKSLDDFVQELWRSGKLDYERLIAGIEDIVGRDRILVLLLEEFTAEPAAAFRRLCHFLGLAIPTPVITGDREKSSASDDVILTKRLCNRLYVEKIFGRRIERFIHQALCTAVGFIVPQLRQRGNPFRLAPEQAERLAAQYAAGNAKLLASLGYDAFADAYFCSAEIHHGEAPAPQRTAARLAGS